jgi:hypothetical protein
LPPITLLIGTKTYRSFSRLAYSGAGRQAKRPLCRCKIPDRELAERLQIDPRLLSEIGGQNNRSPKARCQLFESRREVHGWADAREIQPITAANVAVEHFADMKRQTKAHSMRIGKRVDGSGSASPTPQTAAEHIGQW